MQSGARLTNSIVFVNACDDAAPSAVPNMLACGDFWGTRQEATYTVGAQLSATQLTSKDGCNSGAN